jgi:hypothetical protein
VHGDVGFARLHCHFQLFYEKAFAADFLQAAVENLVAARRKGYELDRVDLGQRSQDVSHVFRLPERERALACRDTNFQGLPPLM